MQKTSQKPLLQVMLVTIGINEPYETNVRAMVMYSRMIGFYNVLAWTEVEFLNEPLTRLHVKEFDVLKKSTNESFICHTFGKACRPYCAAFKPVALLRAMSDSPSGTYVMWADSSQYFNYSYSLRHHINGSLSVLSAVKMLVAGYPFPEPASLYGVAHCDCGNMVCASNGAYVQPLGHVGDYPWLDQFELSALQAMCPTGICAAVNDLWVENPHLLLAKTHFNHQLLNQWLTMALQTPKAFCRSHSQDQAAWSMLVAQHHLPILAFSCPYVMKNISNVLLGLAAGAFKWIDRTTARWPLANGVSNHPELADNSIMKCKSNAQMHLANSCPARGVC